MRSHARTMLVPGSDSVSIWQAGEAAYIYAKAWVAQRLIASAWDRSLGSGVGDDRLTLVTCYPFDSPVPGGTLRYVVVATRRDAAVTRI